MTVVKEVTVQVTQDQLEDILEVINRYELDEGIELTLEQVLANDELLTYICETAVDDGVLALYDPLEFWNNDGWCDVQDHI